MFGFHIKAQIACYGTVLLTLLNGECRVILMECRYLFPLKPQCTGFVTTLDTHTQTHTHKHTYTTGTDTFSLYPPTHSSVYTKKNKLNQYGNPT